MRDDNQIERPGLAAAAAYGLFQFPMGLMIPPLTLMLPGFFAETMGVKLAAVGAVAGAMRLVHIASDPMTGALCDRTSTPLGRRKPWMLAGVLLALAAIWLLFAPPVATATPAYLGLGLFLFYISTSFIQIPYYAWGAEYPATPYGRARMLGIREVAGLVGLLLSGAAPLAATAMGYPPNGRAAMGGLACALALMLPTALAVLIFVVPEPQVRAADKGRVSLVQTLRDFWAAVAGNPAYRVSLVGCQTINIGIAIGQSISYFYLSRILKMPQLFGVLLLAGGLCAVLSAPFWIWLSKRAELRNVIAVGVIGSALVHMIGFWFLKPGQVGPLLGVELLQATLLASAIILSPNLQALSVEQGALDTGVDRAGTYVSLDQLVSQIANAAPFIVLFPLLAAAGFEPSAPAVGSGGLAALRLAGVFAAGPFQIVGALIVLRFPIDRARARSNAALVRA